MSLDGFKIKSEADDSFHVEHPRGGSFTLDKKSLSPKAMAMIKKMCSGGSVEKFADGGTAAPIQIDLSQPGASPSPIAAEVPNADGLSALQNPLKALFTPSSQALPAPQIPDATAPAMQEPAQVQASVPAAAAAPQTNPLADFGTAQNKTYDKEIGAYQDALKQLGGAYGSQSKAGTDLSAQLAAAKTPEQIIADHHAKDAEFQQKLTDNQIDPNRYYKNQSTGSKILSAIGILVSGIGAGPNGKNLALEGINKAVDADIEAQKSEQSKTMNLWKMNREATNDELQANSLTRNQLISAAQVKMAQSAAGMQNAEGRLRLTSAIAELQKQKDLNTRNSALLLGNGGASEANPLQLVPSIVPAEHQKQVITELGQAQSANENKDKIKELFYQAAKDTRPASGRSAMSVLNTIPGYSPPSIKALNLLYDPLIHDNEGRINELEQQHVQANSPAWGDSDETIDKKWKAIEAFVEHKKSAPTATTFGLDPKNFRSTSSDPRARFTPEQQRVYQAAMANPSNPYAAQALKKLGVSK